MEKLKSNRGRAAPRQTRHPRPVERLEARTLLSAVTWTGAGNDGLWTDPQNWSTAMVPGPADDVTISVPGSLTVLINSGTQSVNSVTCTNGIEVDGGSLEPAAASQIAALAVAGGGVTFSVAANVNDLTVSGGSLAIGSATNTNPVLLKVNDAAVISGGATTVLPGATLEIDGSGLQFTGDKSPIVTLEASDGTPGKLMLGGDVTFAGSGGTASVVSAGNGSLGAIDLGGGVRTFHVGDGSADVDLLTAAPLSDGELHKDGAGWMGLAVADTYSGGTTLIAGTLEVDDASALGSGGVTFAGGTLAVRTTGAADLPNTLAAAPADSINLDLGGSALSVPDLVAGSSLNVSGSAGGSFAINGPVTLGHALNVNVSLPLTINGTVSGSFGLTKTGAGALTLAGGSTNTYTGTTEVVAGSLRLSKDNGAAVPGDLRIDGSSIVSVLAPQQFVTTAAVTFDSTNGSPTLDLGNNSQTVGSLNSAQPGAGTVDFGHGTLSVSAGTFSGTISGSGTFFKEGTGTLSAGTVTGNPALNLIGGILSISGAASVSGLAIAPGASLSLGGTLTLTYGTNPDPVSTIRSYLSSGAITGAAGTLGYAEAADGVVAGLNPQTLVIRPSRAGDANLDGKVDFADLLLLAQHYGQPGIWDAGDFNYDGQIAFGDLLMLAQNYGQSNTLASTTAKLIHSRTRPTLATQIPVAGESRRAF